MERLPRFTIYLGISIGVIIFGMFLYSVLPHMIQNSANDWERAIGNISDSEEKLMAKFTAHPAYIAFYETYPNAKEEFENRSRGNGNLNVGIMDFDTGNQILLDMYYDTWDDRINVNVRCMIVNDEGRHDDNLRADGLFAEDFIRNVDCLNRIESTSKIDS